MCDVPSEVIFTEMEEVSRGWEERGDGVSGLQDEKSSGEGGGDSCAAM